MPINAIKFLSPVSCSKCRKNVQADLRVNRLYQIDGLQTDFSIYAGVTNVLALQTKENLVKNAELLSMPVNLI